MSQIDNLVFSNYVNQQRVGLKSTLLSKNIKATDKDSLGTLVSKVATFSPINDATYHRDAYFQQLITNYKNDPKYSKNGGAYSGFSYLVLSNKYSTTALYIYAGTSHPIYIEYSDGTSETITQTTEVLHTWAQNETLVELEDGTKTRLIKIYTNAGDDTNFTRCAIQKCPKEFGETTYSGTSELIFALVNVKSALPQTYSTNSTSGTSLTSLVYAKNLRYLYFGENFIKIGAISGSSGYGSSDSKIAYCSNLECIESEMAVAVVLGTGSSIKELPNLKYWLLKIASLDVNTLPNFARLTYITDDLAELSNKVFSIGVSNSQQVIQFPSATTQSVNYIVSDNRELVTYDLPDIEYTGSQVYPYAYRTPQLRYLTIPQNFQYNLNLSNCPLLSTTSIQGIIDNLKDLTGLTVRTITIPYIIDLTQAQMEQITSKNWTLSRSY